VISKPRVGSEQHIPGQFDSVEHFLTYCRGKCLPALFPFTKANGEEVKLRTNEAIDALDQVSKFIGNPSREDIPAMHDGRMIVAHHNVASLTQHLRWNAGLDGDSRPRRGSMPTEPAPIKWPYAAQLWFWRNGGPPLEGEQGSFNDWHRNITRTAPKPFSIPDAGALAKPMPEEVPF
jgi:hypothetical protein